MRYTGHTLHILHMQWDYLEHQYAGLVRSQGRQRRRAQGSSAGQRVAPGPHAAVQQAGSSSGSALGDTDAAKEGDAQHRDEAEAEAEAEAEVEAAAEAAAEAADEPQLSAGLELLERARLLTASDGGGEWAALTLDETWLERPEALRECATRASAGHFLRAAPDHAAHGVRPGCGRATLQGGSVPWLQGSELLHVGVLLAGRLEAALWDGFALAAAQAPGGTERLQRRTKAPLPPAAGPVRAGQELCARLRALAAGGLPAGVRDALCGAQAGAARGVAPADVATRLCFAPLTLALSSGAPRLLALRHTLEAVAAERAAAALLGGPTGDPARDSAAQPEAGAADAEGDAAAAAAAERRRRKREKQKGRRTEAAQRAGEERAASDAAARREAAEREAAAAAAAAALGAVLDLAWEMIRRLGSALTLAVALAVAPALTLTLARTRVLD